MYKKIYNSPLGNVYMISDGKYLTGLWFEGSRDSLKHIGKYEEKDLPIFKDIIKWLDIYFDGKIPDFVPKYKLEGLTPFRKMVIDIVSKIPYGKVITYNDIAKEIAIKKGIKRMSSQAVGGAVGYNPICIIIPCHRVIGSNGSLVGYGGGLKNKIGLLKLEKNDMSKFSIPSSDKTAIKRCSWCNLKNSKYIEYHDNEWGVPNFDDKYLLEMLILESFQAGLSWECVLNKREAFKKAYDDFDIEKICLYDDKKVMELFQNRDIIRNKRKIIASINNAKVFKKIQNEYTSFCKYLETFTNGITIYELGITSSNLSDSISKDLNKRGMTFVGTTIIYSYLQAIGVIYSHEKCCFMFDAKEIKKEKKQ